MYGVFTSPGFAAIKTVGLLGQGQVHLINDRFGDREASSHYATQSKSDSRRNGFHVLNLGVGRRQLFDKEADYAAFEQIHGTAKWTCFLFCSLR